MPLSFLCVNTVPSHQIIQLVNKSKFPWNCTLFKPSKRAAVSSVYAWWSPGGGGWWIYPLAGSTAGYLGAVWATGPVSILDGVEKSFFVPSHTSPTSLKLAGSHTSLSFSISYATGLEPEFTSTNPHSKHRGDRATHWGKRLLSSFLCTVRGSGQKCAFCLLVMGPVGLNDLRMCLLQLKEVSCLY